MIERLIIKNFKSLKHVELALGSMNLFIGANASGKSNFFDALRTLQGIGAGFTIQEVLDGKPKSATSEVWDGIRGGSAKACFTNGDDTGEVVLEAKGRLEDGSPWRFLTGFVPKSGRISRETLEGAEGEIYHSDVGGRNRATDAAFTVVYSGKGKQGRPPHFEFERTRPVLGQFARTSDAKVRRGNVETAEQVARLLANTQRVDPSPALLRGYSQAHQIRRMGERGENFAALVATICANPTDKDDYLSWLRQLRPAEVEDVGTLSGAVGEPLFMLRERGRTFPAQVLSDGTLRFAAITAAFFQADLPAVMTIEEIENGIHASRVRLLVELLRNRATRSKTQVMATTHSPIVLSWLQSDEYAHTFLCKRDESTGESQIRPLTDVPAFLDVVRRQPIADLFAEGWLESSL